MELKSLELAKKAKRKPKDLRKSVTVKLPASSLKKLDTVQKMTGVESRADMIAIMIDDIHALLLKRCVPNTTAEADSSAMGEAVSGTTSGDGTQAKKE